LRHFSSIAVRDSLVPDNFFSRREPQKEQVIRAAVKTNILAFFPGPFIHEVSMMILAEAAGKCPKMY
jgi:hypothetical protein